MIPSGGLNRVSCQEYREFGALSGVRTGFGRWDWVNSSC